MINQLFFFMFFCFTHFSIQLVNSTECNVDYQPSIDDVVQHYFKDIPSHEIKISSMPGGHSTNGAINLLLMVNGKKYALKIKPEAPPSPFEYYAMAEGAKAGISPGIYYASQDRKTILMEYIEGDTLTVAEANKPSNCIQIGQAIRKAHSIKKNPYLFSNEEDDLEKLFLEICHHPHITKQLHEAISIMKACNVKLKDFDSCKVNNHGDLNSRNIFLTAQGPILIDWEYTYCADPFEDLSYLSLRHNYDQKTEQLLLESYFGRRPSTKEMERYYIIKKKYFAKLCIYFHYFSLKFNPEGVKCIAEIDAHRWFEHMVAYSERRDEMPLDQLYFELAECALQQARH